jgi:phosphohistidine phosphatase
MKKIIFLRHGKATDKWPMIDDWSRHLIEKWEERTIQYLSENRDKIVVDTIISSGAWRAKMTAEIAALELWIDRNDIQYHPWLRTDNYQSIIDMIFSFPPTWESVLLVWHNDTLTEAAMSLSKKPLEPMLKSWLVWLTYWVQDWTSVDKKNNTNAWQYNGPQ